MEYTVIKSKRRTLCIIIKPNGDVVVKVPVSATFNQIEKFVESKRSWIDKRLSAINNAVRLPIFTECEIAEKKRRTLLTVKAKVERFARLIGVSYGKITVRAQKTVWGSCTKFGNLSFNCLIADLPDEVADYIVVHELCHRVYMNHSAKFWSLVESVLPDYKKIRKFLKDNGGILISRIADR